MQTKFFSFRGGVTPQMSKICENWKYFWFFQGKKRFFPKLLSIMPEALKTDLFSYFVSFPYHLGSDDKKNRCENKKGDTSISTDHFANMLLRAKQPLKYLSLQREGHSIIYLKWLLRLPFNVIHRKCKNDCYVTSMSY